MKTKNVKELVKELQEASDAYHNGTPIMTDAEFDAKLEELKQVDPENDFIRSVGAGPSDTKWAKIKHQTVHGSQHKVQTKEDLKEWIAKHSDYDGDYLVQEKLDGITLILKYELGNIVSAATRGDGFIGEEIIKNAMLCNGIPKVIKDFSGTVRGELLLPLSSFKKYFEPLGCKNARNSLAKIRSDEHELIKHFQFMPFDLIGEEDFSTEKEVNDKLEELFGLSVASKVAADAEEIIELYDEYITSKRDNLNWLIDGLIVRINDLDYQESLGHTSRRPNGQIAFKFPPKLHSPILKILNGVWG